MNDVLTCKNCPRLVTYLQQVKQQFPDYHCQPVPSLGEAKAGLLLVGLAPGIHGANATGLPFIGDAAGHLLYKTLYACGFCSHPQPRAGDDFHLINCCVTNAVKCLPPHNKPGPQEIENCNHFLAIEICQLKQHAIVVALGHIAHKAILKALKLRQKDFPFKHAAEYALNPSLTLIDSYHCSRYNTQTGRLTEAMFGSVFSRIQELLQHDG
jgi:uracil-DNA glycosylase family 4